MGIYPFRQSAEREEYDRRSQCQHVAKPAYLELVDQIFVLNDGTTKLWFNAIGYLGYNGAGGWFDCQNNNADNALTAGVWTLVTLNFMPDKFEAYYNGVREV